jgi:ketosteroid isomerase-like protein
MPVDSDLQRYTRGLWCLRHITALTIGIALALATSSAATAADEVSEPLAEAVRTALDAWSQFATTGDLSALGSSFGPDGPQWRQFEAESPAWQGATNAEALRLELRELRLRHLESTTATVWAEVEAIRAGFVSEVFGWDFDLIRDGGRWWVWTVVAAEAPSELAQVPPVTTSTVASTTTTPAAAITEPGSSESPPMAAAAGRSRGTRLPAVSAWIVVVTVVGVAVAGYMAPRIDKRADG